MFAKLVELKDTLNDEFTIRSTDFDTTLPPIDDDNDDDYALAMPYDDDYTLFDAILEATKDDATRDMVFVLCLAHIVQLVLRDILGSVRIDPKNDDIIKNFEEADALLESGLPHVLVKVSRLRPRCVVVYVVVCY